MRLYGGPWALPAASLVVGLTAMASPWPRSGEEWTIVVSGDTAGYLSPCGCTSPMSGGIRRRATAIRSMSSDGRTLVVDNGALVAGQGRQDEIKAETMAEALASMGADAVNLTLADARLGKGEVLSLASLSGGRFISTSLRASQTNPVKPFAMKGPFLIGGIATQATAMAEALGESAVGADEAVERLLEEAKAGRQVPVLLLAGTRDEARKIAKDHTGLALIVFQSSGSPDETPERIGETMLATPGERGKHIVQATATDGRIAGYKAVNLGPEYTDDPAVAKLYSTYLKRVDQEGLLDALPREKGPAYAGPSKCGTCHAEALKIWKKSGHSHAFATLEAQMHGRDPDCVSCHVTGLESTRGFVSRLKTPALASVTCESCHGPAAAHAVSPAKAKMKKLTEQTCVRCHTVDQSPNFDFATYWKRIAH